MEFRWSGSTDRGSRSSLAEISSSERGTNSGNRFDSPDAAGFGANKAKLSVWVMGLCILAPLPFLAIPLYVIRPFVPQAPQALALALELRRLGPIVSAVCVAVGLAVMAYGWRTARRPTRLVLGILLGLATVEACAARINIFEEMFHPYSANGFASAGNAAIDGDDKVLAVAYGGEAHAYPVRLMGYHHVVNDTVGDLPIAVTYCTLCHSGLVWRRQVDGRTLRFRLAGINNGNALLRDEETGTVWQQSTGEAIFGPLKGHRLEIVRSDELTFALWRTEQPQGQVLKPDPSYVTQYDPKDWEKHIETTHTVVDTGRTGIGPHRLMLGVMQAGKSKAYPLDAVLRARVVEDRVGGLPILLLVGPDGISVRVFAVRIANREAATFVADGALVRDAETGSAWNFQGCAVEGKLTGTCLPELESHLDYWFDWMNHHPETLVFHG